jgi:HEPN domain-containing protein
MHWKDELRRELEQAEAARASGNEGRARVCARRAAGIAAREYLKRIGQPVQTASVLTLLNHIQTQAVLSPDLKQAAAHLTLRVTETFSLPVPTDLIAEASKLCHALLPDWEE